MTDFQTWLINTIKIENGIVDEKLVSALFFLFQDSEKKFPASIDTLIELGIFDRKNNAKRTLDNSRFSLGKDFCIEEEKSTGGRPAKKIMLTIECFQELCILVQNEKGKQARHYLIIAGRLWKQHMEEQFSKLKDEIEEARCDIREKDKQLYAIKRRHKSIEAELGTKRPGFYIISDQEQSLCSKECKRPRRQKAGIDGVNVAKRLDSHKTDIPTLRIDFLVYLRKSDAELLEQMLLRRYEEDRFPYVNHEWIFNIPIDEMIDSAKHLIQYLGMEHIYEDKIASIDEDTVYKMSLKCKDEYETPEPNIDLIVQTINEQDRNTQDIQIQLEEHFDAQVKEIEKCADCQSNISTGATYCKSCSSKRTCNRKCPNKPSKEELEKMLCEMLQKDIAAKLGVGTGTVWKWKKEYGINLNKT